MTQTQPNLSVVIPVYNTEKHLRKCIDSLLTQTYNDFELIFVDNGSSDDSVAICREYAARTDKIRLLSVPTPGVAKARNAGIEAAHGRYITFVDSDDWAEPEYFAAFFRTALPADTDSCIVIQDLLLDVSENPKPRKKSHPLFNYTDATFTRGESDVQIAVRQQLLHNGFTVGKLYATELLHRHGLRFPEEDIMCEDHIFFFNCLRHTNTIIWRGGGPYMHYMRRGFPTLSSQRHSACKRVRTAQLLESHFAALQTRFDIADPAYIATLYDALIFGMLMSAVRFMNRHNYQLTLRAIAAHKERFKALDYTLVPQALLTKRTLRMTCQLSDKYYFTIYVMTRIEKILRQLLHQR